MDSFQSNKTFTKDHTIPNKFTPASKIHAKALTLDHTIHGVAKTFAEKAYNINVTEQRPFSYLDYPQLSKCNFRQIIRKLGDKIERVGNSRPQFYKLKGIKLPGDTRNITLEGMRVSNSDFLKLLSSVKDQPPMIHDIKIKIANSELHTALLDKGVSKDYHNHSIKINFDSTDSNITTKILVYPNTIQIDLGCTYKPLIYDSKSIWYLHEHLSKISYHLTGLSGVLLPTVDTWIITHWHFNKDGSEAFNGQNFHHTIEDVNTGLFRFYSKTMEDGTVIPRLEQIQTPHNSLEEEMKRAMFSEV